MTTTQVEKFLFKTLSAAESVASKDSFEAGFGNLFKKQETPSTIQQAVIREEVKTYHEHDLIKSKTQGYEEGYAKGYSDAKTASDSVNEQISNSLKIIVDQLKKISCGSSESNTKSANDLVEIAIKISEKVTGETLNKESVSNVEEVVRKSLDMLFEEEKLVFFVNDAILDKVKNRIDVVIAEKGFAGNFEIKGDNSLGQGGCKIEWKGGGMVSDKEGVWKEIYKICDNFFV